MSSYYINAGSLIEDGLNPETGFHNFTSFRVSYPDSALNHGDIVNFVASGGTVDDHLGGSVPFTIGKTLTYQSWSGNTNKPTWYVPNIQLTTGVTSLNIFDMRIKGRDPTISIIWVGEPDSDVYPPVLVEANIERCELFNCFSMYFYNIKKLRIVNNIFKTTTDIPIVIESDIGSNIPDLEEVSICNNTFYNIQSAWSACIFAIIRSDVGIDKFKVQNNIFEGGTGRFALYDEVFNVIPAARFTNSLVDYNVFYEMPTGNIDPLLIGTHETNADPDLVDPPNDDFYLQSSSPCLNAGVGPDVGHPEIPTDDFDGVARETPTDIGTYQFFEPPTVSPREVKCLGTGSVLINGDFILTGGTFNMNGFDVQVGI